MSLTETREETEARLIAAHEKRVRENVRNCSADEYAVLQREMLKTARDTAIGRAPQRDTSDVRGLSESEYRKREQDMLRHARQLRTR